MKALLISGVGLALGFAGCGPTFQHDPGLEQELAGRSRTEGLAILTTSPTTGTLPITYFDGSYEQLNCCGNFRQSWVAAGGRTLITVDRSSFALGRMDPRAWGPNAAIFDLRGEEVDKLPSWIHASFVSISLDGKMIAFTGQGGPPPSSGGKPERGLLFGPLDATAFRTLYPTPSDLPATRPDRRPETISWSPNGSEIAYGKDGTIQVYNLKAAASRSLAKGSNPLWSPDGGWISYRGLNGEAMIVDPLGKHSRQLIKGQTIVHALHWSPDSRYLLLTLTKDEGELTWHHLMIYRLADGAMTGTGDPGLNLDDSGEDWVLTGRRH